MKRKIIQKKLGTMVTALMLGTVTISGFHTVSATGIQDTASGVQEEVQTPTEETAPEVPETPSQSGPAGGTSDTAMPDVETPGASVDAEIPEDEGSVDAELPDTEIPEEDDSSDTETPDTEIPEEDGSSDTETPDTEIPEGDGSSDTETPDAETPEGDDSSDTETPDAEMPEEDGSSDTEMPDAEMPEEDDSSDAGMPDADVPDTETPAQDTSGAAVSDTGESEEEIVSSPAFVRDNRPAAYYEERSYDPSEAFLEQGEKIKYSTDMPLENIPAFITPEMIIGALKVQDEYGYPASVTIAQIIQESGFGIYGPYGEEGQGLSYLAYQYNNLFGIKGTGPAGSVSMRTGEQTSDGQTYTIRAGFRVYHTYTEAIEDRAELLQSVYSDLIEGVNDANTFAMRIGSRWATDIRYAQNLIRQMETYDLYRLDRMTLGEFSELLGDFADPCPGSEVTSEFGWREWSNSYHKGIDLGTGSENIPTYAAAAGTVTTAGWDDAAGYWIAIDHGDGLVTKYMHHKELYVKEGDHVEKGQQIGLSGTTGRSTGNHLHFQLEINGSAVDPRPYLFTDESADEKESE